MSAAASGRPPRPSALRSPLSQPRGVFLDLLGAVLVAKLDHDAGDLDAAAAELRDAAAAATAFADRIDARAAAERQDAARAR